MLNLISVGDISACDTAVAACARFGMGAVLPAGVVPARPTGTGADVFVRPRAFWAADDFGRSREAAGLTVALGLRNSRKPYQHTTRITAQSGGPRGPHPAREPV